MKEKNFIFVDKNINKMKYPVLPIATVLLAVSVLAGCVRPVDTPTYRPSRPENQNPIPDQQPEAPENPSKSGLIVVAYASSWTSAMPNPEYVTHVNYAFGHINNDFESVRVDNDARLKKIVDLKKDAPHLKVLLSIGGWGSGNFSEMAASEKHRTAFAKACKAVADKYQLDGIDIDWEYPTSNSAGISSSPDDTRNYTLLMKDLREALGSGLLLTYASANNAGYVDAKEVIKYVDFVNDMAYDMGYPPNNHDAALYRSSKFGCWCSVEESVNAHLKAGIPKEKLVMGMPFYGRGSSPYDYDVPFRKNVEIKPGCSEGWDDVAKEPYIIDSKGTLVLSFENEKSITEKCKYIKEKGFLGGMYWELGSDDAEQTLSRTVAEQLLQ